MIVKSYEIQTPFEAEKVMGLGVTNFGSVILSRQEWRVPIIQDAIRLVQSSGFQSSVIPLFSDRDMISKVLDYYPPDIVHFCDAIASTEFENQRVNRLARIQEGIRERFPVILAGGICPDNAYEAVMKVQPAGVDSCTGTNATDVGGNPVRFQKDRDNVKKNDSRDSTGGRGNRGNESITNNKDVFETDTERDFAVLKTGVMEY
jgi:hypothetical protein